MTVHEIQVMILFIILILLWFFKTPIFMPGWGDLFSATNSDGDRVVIAQVKPLIGLELLICQPIIASHWSLENQTDILIRTYVDSKSE